MRNISRLYELLSIISSVGVDKLAIEPTQDGGTTFRGVDNTESIFILDTIDEELVEGSMAIHSLGILLKRMSLFGDSLDSVEVELDMLDDEWVRRMTLSSDTIDVSYTFTAESALTELPTMKGEWGTIQTIQIDKKEFDSISQAMSSMGITGEDILKIRATSANVFLEFSDDSDTFKKKLCKNITGEKFSAQWRAIPTRKVLGQSLAHSDIVEVTVSDRMVGEVKVGDLEVMIRPE